MSKDLVLGLDPGRLVLNLPRNATFDRTLRFYNKATGAPVTLPAGTQISLVFDADSGVAPWVATVSGDSAQWTQSVAVVNTVPDGTGVRIRYVNGSSDYPLWIGKVNAS